MPSATSIERPPIQRQAAPAEVRNSRTHESLGALRQTLKSALLELEGGSRPDKVARTLRNGMAFAEGLRTGEIVVSCPQCSRYLELESERALARRVGCCSRCSDDRDREDGGTAGVFTLESFDAWLSEESARG